MICLHVIYYTMELHFLHWGKNRWLNYAWRWCLRRLSATCTHVALRLCGSFPAVPLDSIPACILSIISLKSRLLGSQFLDFLLENQYFSNCRLSWYSYPSFLLMGLLYTGKVSHRVILGSFHGRGSISRITLSS